MDDHVAIGEKKRERERERGSLIERGRGRYKRGSNDLFVPNDCAFAHVDVCSTSVLVHTRHESFTRPKLRPVCFGSFPYREESGRGEEGQRDEGVMMRISCPDDGSLLT